MRTFVALPLSAEAQKMLRELQHQMNGLGADVRWIPIESIHLTLKFLGEIEPSLLPQLADGIRGAAAGCGNFSLTLGGLGAFPNLKAPNILWCGVRGDMASLRALHQAVENACAESGFAPEERSFAPHLTVGRVRSPRNLRPLLNYIKINSALECMLMIQRLNIYQSTLSPRGATYKILETFPLRGGYSG